jgi:hypothetical protein
VRAQQRSGANTEGAITAPNQVRLESAAGD